MATVWNTRSWIGSNGFIVNKQGGINAINIQTTDKPQSKTKTQGTKQDARCRNLVAVVASVIGILALTAVALVIVLLNKGSRPQLRITAVAEITSLYVDGSRMELKENAKSVYIKDTYEFDEPPTSIAVCVNSTNYLAPALLADFLDVDQVALVTNSTTWKCTSNRVEGTGWTEPEFDDSDWTYPVEISSNGLFTSRPDIYVTDVSDDAVWITTGLAVSQMYCRYSAGKSRDNAESRSYSELISESVDLLNVQLERFLAGGYPGDEVPLLTLRTLFEGNLLADRFTTPAVLIAPLDLTTEIRLTSAVREALDALRQREIRPLSPDESFPLPSFRQSTCFWPQYTCPQYSSYRSFDGSCNNLQNPISGRAFTPFHRTLPPQYSDGTGEFVSSRNGRVLPGVREVCKDLSLDKSRLHRLTTLAVMAFGQLLDHDITMTPVASKAFKPREYSRKTDITCGSDGCSREHEDCFPIQIPPGDPDFRNKTCFKFIRSQPFPTADCVPGMRSQLNKVTSAIDASMVYGSTEEEASDLRNLTDSSRGRLRVQKHPKLARWKPLLPSTHNDVECAKFEHNLPCFKAGDERVNEHHTLTVFHTFFMREHNRLEDRLHSINPSWSGEKLYQETRRILGAVIQHITYNEFLPPVLSKTYMTQKGLNLQESGYYQGYNSSVPLSVANAFGTAAFRFGHSIVANTMKRADSDWDMTSYPSLPLSMQFFRPDELYNTDNGGLDAFMRGTVNQKVEKCDRNIASNLTKSLFATQAPHGEGTDLFSLNLQRGRDHGLPPYNDWRELCGLPRATDFNDLQDIDDPGVKAVLRKHYGHVDDVDLYPAALSERPLTGALVGPTFACIIADQFRRFRDGDRFWYENPPKNHQPFSLEQLEELRKVSLAGILCDNSDSISQLQPYVMQLPFRQAYPENDYDSYDAQDHGLSREEFNDKWMRNHNARVSCAQIPSLNLEPWRD